MQLTPKISRSGVRLFLIALFLLVLAGAAFIQAGHLDYPVAARGGDGNRDHLVASHIADYGEYPLVGPIQEASRGTIPNSPVYWYLLGAFASFSGDILFLELVGMLFWVLGIAFLFLFAYLAFGPVAAYAAGALSLVFTFAQSQSGEGIMHFSYLYQPMFMVPLVFFALFLLLLGYRLKSLLLVIASVVVWTFAGAVHNSAFALFPFFLAAIGVVLWRWKAGRNAYASVAASALFSIILWYLPVLLYAFSANLPLFQRPAALFSASALLPRAALLIESLPGGTAGALLLALTGILYALLYFSPFVRRSREAKGITGLLLAASLFYLALALSLSLFRDHQLLLVYGLLAVAGSEIVRTIFSQHFLLKLAGIPLLALAVLVFVRSPGFENSIPARTQATSNQELVWQASDALVSEIRDIQQKEGYEKPDFFQLSSYLFVGEHEDPAVNEVIPIWNEILWAPLEQNLEVKLTYTELVGKSAFLRTTNGNSTTFVVCYAVQPTDSTAWCAEAFRKGAVLEQVYESPSLSILKTAG